MIRFPQRLLFSRLSPPAASLWTYAPNLSPAPWPFSGHIGNTTQLPCSISHFPQGRQGKRFRSVLSKWLQGAGRKSSSGVGSRVLSPGHSIWWGWADQSHQVSSDIHTLSGWAPSCGCLSIPQTSVLLSMPRSLEVNAPTILAQGPAGWRGSSLYSGLVTEVCKGFVTFFDGSGRGKKKNWVFF